MHMLTLQPRGSSKSWRRSTLLLALCSCLFLTLWSTQAQAAQKKKPAQVKKSRGKAKAVKPISQPLGAAYEGRADAMALADQIAAEQGLEPAWVRQQLGRARMNPNVVRLMTPAPATFQKNWLVYRSRFIEPQRLNAGVLFWKKHENTLLRAEQAYGVPAAIIVGIIGVETLYGRDTGQFSVLDSLSTLALDFPRQHPKAEQRQAFFRSELAHFLQLAHQSGREPASYLGSYAGAMGWPQFMPGSWRKYAVDFDGDGRIDLFDSVPDVIGSVAHYFRQHGWQTGMPTHYEARFAPGQSARQRQELLEPDILPSFTAADVQRLGMDLDAATLAHPGKLALVELRNGPDAPQYILGTDNFYVITRYNWSAYYAAAVIELGAQVQNQHLGAQR